MKKANGGRAGRCLALWVWIGSLSWLLLSGCQRPQPQAAPVAGEATTVAPSTVEGPKKGGEAEQAAAQKSFLWEVSSPSAQVYLLGSVHIAKTDLYPLAPAIESAYESAARLVLEVHLSPQAAAEASRKSLQLGTYAQGDSVGKHLSPEAWSRYSQYLQAKGKPLDVFVRIKPWLATTALAMEELGDLGYSPTLGIDRYFQHRAEAEHKPIDELETIDEQLGLLAGLDEGTQELMLRDFLDNEGKLGEQMAQAFDAWNRGDATGVQAALLESMERPEFRPVYEKVFVARNLRMTAAVIEFLAGEGVRFMVVGSGHLVGKDGIVEKLRKAEFTVNQL